MGPISALPVPRCETDQNRLQKLLDFSTGNAEKTRFLNDFGGKIESKAILLDSNSSQILHVGPK